MHRLDQLCRKLPANCLILKALTLKHEVQTGLMMAGNFCTNRPLAGEGESYRGFLCERGFRFYAEGHKSTFSTAFMSSSILLADTKAGISHNTVFLVVEQRAFRSSSMGGIYLSRFEVVETANRMI